MQSTGRTWLLQLVAGDFCYGLIALGIHFILQRLTVHDRRYHIFPTFTLILFSVPGKFLVRKYFDRFNMWENHADPPAKQLVTPGRVPGLDTACHLLTGRWLACLVLTSPLSGESSRTACFRLLTGD